MTAAGQRAAVLDISEKQLLILLGAVLFFTCTQTTASANLAAAEAQQVRRALQSSKVVVKHCRKRIRLCSNPFQSSPQQVSKRDLKHVYVVPHSSSSSCHLAGIGYAAASPTDGA
jgi:hypothetical protein